MTRVPIASGRSEAPTTAIDRGLSKRSKVGVFMMPRSRLRLAPSETMRCVRFSLEAQQEAAPGAACRGRAAHSNVRQCHATRREGQDGAGLRRSPARLRILQSRSGMSATNRAAYPARAVPERQGLEVTALPSPCRSPGVVRPKRRPAFDQLKNPDSTRPRRPAIRRPGPRGTSNRRSSHGFESQDGRPAQWHG